MMNELKESIKNTPISTIIGHYLPLNKRGANYLGICPFHTDNKPSLTINDTKGLFKCFACGTAGDSITFVELYKKMDFKEAILELAQILNLSTDNLYKKDPKKNLGKKILKNTSLLYQKLAQTESCSPFIDFKKDRGIDKEVVNDFNLGFAPASNALTSYLSSIPNTEERNKAIELALEIGIIRENSQNSYYDTFRDRIMFPICDQWDNTVGFGSRRIHEHQKAKYINSQESFMFNKSRILYGLNVAKTHIREKDQVILVEGYMDIIALHQYGFKNSVAVMGLALGTVSLDTLISMSKNVVLALDSDKSGISAMERINGQFMEKNILPRLLDFTPYKDPDEYLVNTGSVEFSKLLEKAPIFLDDLLAKSLPKKLPTDSDGKLKILDDIFRIVSPLGSELSATERILSLAQQLEIKSDTQQILQVYNKLLNSRPNSKRNVSATKLLSEQPQSRRPVLQKVERSKGSLDRTLKQLIVAVILNPEIINYSQFEEILDFVSHNGVKRLFGWLKNLHFENKGLEYTSDIKGFLTTDEINTELKEVIASCLFKFESVETSEKVAKKMIFDFKKKLIAENYKKERNQFITDQMDCSDENERAKILIKIAKVDKKITENKKTKYLEK